MLEKFFKQDKKSYDLKDIEILTDVSESILSTIELDVLLQKSVDQIVSRYKFLGGILLLREGSSLYAKTISKGKVAGKFLDLIEMPISSLKTEMDKNFDNKIVQSINSKTIVITDDLNDFTKGVISEKVSNLAKRVTNTQSCISLPVQYGTEVFGAFFLSQNRKTRFEFEMPILKTFANQIAIALINAKLYEDISKQVEELKSKNDELNALRRREQDMMDIMGHELRTPLSIMRISLGLLTERYSRSENKDVKCDEYITRMKDALDREVRLLETMLNSTKIEANKIELRLERVDLDRIIKDTMLALGSKAQKKSLQFIYNPLPSGNYVYADSVRLGEVIDNLVLNAIKYTEKGSVTISLKEVDKGIEISISDTGIGIPKEDIKHLGEKFYRVGQYSNNVADSEVRKKLEESQPTLVRPGGTGLGLYVSFNLVELMGGKVKVTSTVGKGSTFSFVIPKYEKQPDTHSHQKVEKNIFSRLGFTQKQS